MKSLLFIFLSVIPLFANTVDILESRYMFDSDHSYNVDAVYANAETFENFDYASAAFGFKDETLWIYLKLKDVTGEKRSNVIEFLYALHDYVEVYEYSGGILVDTYLTGDRTLHDTRRLDVNHIVVPYTMHAGETKAFIFKIDSQSDLSVGMRFLPEEEFFMESNRYEIVLALYYGAVLIMILYNFSLFTFIREKVYLYYVLFHLCLMLSLLASNGLTFTLLWPDLPQINNYFLPMVFILANYFSVRFALSFLELKRYSTRLYNYFRVILFLDTVLFFATFAAGFRILEPMLLLSLFSVFSLFFTGLYMRMRYRTMASKFYVIAWSALLGGVILEELQGLGLLEMNLGTSHATHFGTFTELTLLSIALAYRYNVLNRKLLKTQSELRMLNEHLQEKVDEKTKDLSLMLNELQHRVKNNFQVILTFLRAQKKSTKDECSMAALDQTVHRIEAITSLHKLLDVSSDSTVINIRSYLQSILESFCRQESRIDFRSDIAPLRFGYDRAVMLGLVLNELVTNSRKYAFAHTDAPTVGITLYEKESECVFDYRNNRDVFDAALVSESSGVGFFLIQGFAEKNGAVLSLDDGEGMRCMLRFSSAQ